jgi:hypothetical protein
MERLAMIEFDFCGYACLPGNPIGECLDAAGIDASLDRRGGPDIDAVASLPLR